MSLPSRQDIENVARDVLRELTGASQPRPRGLSRSLISEAEVREARGQGEQIIWIKPGTIVTPLAHDLAQDYKIEIRVHTGRGAPAVTAPDQAQDATPAPAQEQGPIAIGSDHGGFPLKELLRGHLEGRGLKVIDVGTHSKQSCDYPDFAGHVAKLIALGEATWGILVDGAGIGSCMAANKVPGVLAATCHDERTARNSREHNGANVLCLGSGTLDARAARAVVDAWLNTPFAGGRHGRRVDKIKKIERSFIR